MNIPTSLAHAALMVLVRRAEGNSVLLSALLSAVLEAASNPLPVGVAPPSPSLDLGLVRVEIEEILKGKIISAIKEYRARTGLGLKESKEAIDRWLDINGGERLRAFGRAVREESSS